MDFITCLPSSRGKSTILTVVDRLSKYGHFIPLPPSLSAQLVAETFVVAIILLHIPHRSIMTDRDPKHFISSSNGQSEALNKCVEQYLRFFVADDLHKWVDMLPWA